MQLPMQILVCLRLLLRTNGIKYQNLIWRHVWKVCLFINWKKMVDILCKLTVLCLFSHFVVYVLKLVLILFYNRIVETQNTYIVAGVLKGDMLAPYLFIICLDYALRTSIDKIRENGFELTKKRSRRYPAKTITDADYADDKAILANISNQAETLLHSLERAPAGIGLYVNAHKTEYMCYNQTGDISTLDGTPLKLVDKFTYLGSSVASTEKDIDTRLTKSWTDINSYRLYGNQT